MKMNRRMLLPCGIAAQSVKYWTFVTAPYSIM